MNIFGVGLLAAALGSAVLLLCVRRARPGMTMAFAAMVVVAGAAVSFRSDAGFWAVGFGLLLGLVALSRDADERAVGQAAQRSGLSG